jgi:hypothetical protein
VKVGLVHQIVNNGVFAAKFLERKDTMFWQSIETAPHEVRVLVYLPDRDQVVEAWYSPNTGLWPRDQEFNEDGEACNVGLPTHWMPLPNPPKQYSASIDAELAEEIDACLSLIRHNKVYEELEEVDVEAYNMAETLIETLRDKLENSEKSRDRWRSMWEKEHTENEELQSLLADHFLRKEIESTKG